MFAGVALLCFLTSIVSTEPWRENISLSSADEVPVTITMNGEHARSYVRMVRSSTVSKSFQKSGVVQIDGLLISSDRGGLVVRHAAMIKRIGEPLQQLTLEASLDSSDATNNLNTSIEPDTHTDRNPIQITDKHQVRMSTRKLVGGFPDSARYH